MPVINFSAVNQTCRNLFANGLSYRVPRFQRDYSWGEEEWKELWEDILGTLPEDGEPAHYMGYLVLQSGDRRVFDVIDGQQRLTTISLIILAAMRLLKRLAAEGKAPEENRRRLDQLRASYIGALDPVSLTSYNKLTLNRHNDSYYRDYLVTLADRLPQRGFPASTHLMRKGFEWFERCLRDRVKQEPDPGKALAQFVETLSDKIFFTVITVTDQLNAYKVFETLNARGVRLSATDLLKNYLFSVLAREGENDREIEELERRWESMVGRLGSEDFPDFLRAHWNSRRSFARFTDLFKVVRHRISGREEVFVLLREMDEDIDTYLALTQPEGSSWPAEWKQRALELHMFSVRQPYPMLMAARRTLSDDDFGSPLRATVIVSFRFNVIGAQHPGEQERVYHTVAGQLHRREARTIEQVLAALRPIYPNDNVFRSDFAEKSIKTTQSRNAKIVRYILSRLEKQLGGVEFDVNSPNYTIEHILPRSPEEGWEAFHDRDLEAFVDRLGNLVMLEAGRNRDLENKPYAEKRQVLQQSGLRLTRQLAEEFPDWAPQHVERWQHQLACLATAIWRIDQLS